MATVVLKLFAGQGTGTDGRMDGQSGNYMLPPSVSIKTHTCHLCAILCVPFQLIQTILCAICELHICENSFYHNIN